MEPTTICVGAWSSGGVRDCYRRRARRCAGWRYRGAGLTGALHGAIHALTDAWTQSGGLGVGARACVFVLVCVRVRVRVLARHADESTNEQELQPADHRATQTEGPLLRERNGNRHRSIPGGQAQVQGRKSRKSHCHTAERPRSSTNSRPCRDSIGTHGFLNTKCRALRHSFWGREGKGGWPRDRNRGSL